MFEDSVGSASLALYEKRREYGGTSFPRPSAKRRAPMLMIRLIEDVKTNILDYSHQ